MSTLAQRIQADAEKFLDPTLLGGMALWQRPGQADVAVRVNFLEGYDLADPSGVPMASALPMALIGTGAAPGLARGHKLSIGGIVYDVLSVEPDSTGLTHLLLSRSPAVAAGAISDEAGNVLVDENGWQVTP